MKARAFSVVGRIHIYIQTMYKNKRQSCMTKIAAMS